MEVPEGFHVDLIASEPDVAADRHVLRCPWSAGGSRRARPTPFVSRARKATDRILIFEDQDADGEFETKKVFAENMNLVSGIEVGFGGV